MPTAKVKAPKGNKITNQQLIFIFITIAGLAILFRKQIGKALGIENSVKDIENIFDASTPIISAIPTPLTNRSELSLGMRNGKVEELQRLLNADIKNHTTTLVPLDVDGIFGKKTEALLLALYGEKTASILDFSTKHKH